MLRNHRLGQMTLFSLLLVFPLAVSAQTLYQVVDIGSEIPNSTSSWGRGINSQGDVVTTFDISHNPGFQAVWKNGQVTVLPSDGNRYPTGIDQFGSVVGGFAGLSKGWIFSQGGYQTVPEPSWLSTNFLYATSLAWANNDLGFYTGVVNQLAPSGSWIPFLSSTEAYLGWLDENGEVEVIRLGLFNNQSTTGWGINELNEVVGAIGPATASSPFVHRNGQYEELPQLGGPLNRAEGINNVGIAVGFVSSVNQTGGFYAGSGAVWDIQNPGAAALTTIGQLGDSNRTWLLDINDAGVAVGNASKFEASILIWNKPICWTAADGIKDLNELLRPEDNQWTITQVQGINEAGQIVGTGRFNGSLNRAVRLDPIAAPLRPHHHSNAITPKTNRDKSKR